MTQPIQVLDHGYIRLIETWGSDERIIEAARQSTDGAFRGWGPVPVCRTCGAEFDSPAGNAPCTQPTPGRPLVDTGKHNHMFEDRSGDEKLLAYLYRNQHSTPFEFAGAVIEVQAPIVVFREWHRHRTQSYSELSARYTPLPDLYYLPTVERVMLNANTPNKQAGRAKGAPELTLEEASVFVKCLRDDYADAESSYKQYLKVGVPQELARLVMPVGHYTRMRASANLRNWLAFMTLRQAMSAQWEIRQYANAMNDILVERFPRTMELFNG